MADDMKMEIILEAVNESTSSFDELNNSLKGVESAVNELTKYFSDFSNSMNSSFREVTAGAEEVEKSVDSALNGMSKTAAESSKGIVESFNEDSKAMNEFRDIIGKGVEIGGLDSINSSLKELANSADETEKSMDSALTGISKTTVTSSKEISESLNADGKAMNELRDNLSKGVEKVGALIAVQMLGDSMKHVGELGEHVFDFAIDQGKDFQQSMKNIQTVLAVNADGTQSWNDKMKDSSTLTGEMQQKALDLGSRGAQSANEVAEAMDAMLRGGVDASTVLNGAIESAQNVSIVTGDKLDESANLVTEISHMFREEFSQNGKTVQENMKTTGDVLSGTLLSARISSQDFLDTLKYVGPVASQLGAGFTDTSAAAALLAQNGIKGSQAGNNLKRALTNLLEPTKGGAAAMEHLGLIVNGHNKLIDEQTGKMKNLTDIQAILHQSLEGLSDAEKAKAAHDIFGQYALAGTLVLANENSEAFGHLKEKIEGVSASDAAAAMLDTFSGHMSQLEAHVQTTAKEFGMSFIPTLEKLLPIGNEVLDWFQHLTEGQKEFGMGILAGLSGLAIVGGGLMTLGVSAKFAMEGFSALTSIFGGVGKAFSGLISLIVANPMVAIFAAIAIAVGVLAYEIYTHWDQIKQWLSDTWQKISDTASQIWGGLKTYFSGLWESIKTTTSELWNSFKQMASNIWNGLINWIKDLWNGFKTWITDTTKAIADGVVNGFKWLYDHNYYFHDLVDFVISRWENLKTNTQAAWDWIKNALNTSWTWIKDTATTVWNGMKDFFSKLWDDIKAVADWFWETEKAGFETIWNAIVKVADTVWTPIKQFFSDIWDSVSSTADSMWSSISSSLSQWWNGAVSEAKSIWDGLKTYFTELWNEAYNWGSNLISKFIDGVKSMASAVADEIKSIGSSISSALGFHDIGVSVSAERSDTRAAMQDAGITPMAEGALVTGPTRAVVGEGREPEFVSPLSTFTDTILPKIVSSMPLATMAGGRGFGGGSTVVNNYITVQGHVLRESELTNIVSRGVWNKAKMQGRI